MPAARDHQAQAQHNRQLLAHLCIGACTHPDWATTVAFYTAVHLLEAYFDRKQKPHSKTHAQRYFTLTSMPELSPVNRSYQELKDLGRVSRYDCRLSAWTAAGPKRAVYLLTQIEQHLQSLP